VNPTPADGVSTPTEASAPPSLEALPSAGVDPRSDGVATDGVVVGQPGPPPGVDERASDTRGATENL
jgi:hypothetical protein